MIKWVENWQNVHMRQNDLLSSSFSDHRMFVWCGRVPHSSRRCSTGGLDISQVVLGIDKEMVIDDHLNG